MFSILWTFIGMLAGLLMVAVFTPPSRKEPNLPTPHSREVYHTPHGCVRFVTKSIPCADNAKSLNFIASQHK